jgi:uncharacterized protein with PhoU and TrkA domain
MAVPESWIGASLRDLALPRRHGISVVAVHDILTNRFQPVLDPDALLKESDTLIGAGPDKMLNRASRLR